MSAATATPCPGGSGGAGQQTYTVQAGDTLSHIAQRHYGKASRWHAIFDANRDQLDNPDLIQPGQVLNTARDRPLTPRPQHRTSVAPGESS